MIVGARQLAAGQLATLTTPHNKYCSGQLVSHTNALIFLNFVFLVQIFCWKIIYETVLLAHCATVVLLFLTHLEKNVLILNFAKTILFLQYKKHAQ